MSVLVSKISGLIRKVTLRRYPRQHSVTLTQKRIYIFPSKQGSGFLLLTLLALLLAINYENNLAFGFCFLLVGLFVISILHTYSNLSGLTITALSAHSCFVGEAAEFRLGLRAAPGREYENLRFKWMNGETVTTDMVGQSEKELVLYQNAEKRGWMRPGPLLVETYYPLGLLRAWTWIETDLRTVIYPAMEPCELVAGSASEGDKGDDGLQDGREDFAGLETYQVGMSPRHIAWKQVARGQGLHAKSYCGPEQDDRWLDWEVWPQLDAERRLKRLSYWVSRLSRQQQVFGLRLPSGELAPAVGERQRIQALKMLALYGLPEEAEL